MSCGPDCKFTSDITTEHLCRHIKQKIPTCIPYEYASIVPSRRTFTNPVLYNVIKKMVSTKQELLFLPVSVQERIPEYAFGIPHSREFIYGILPCGSKACVIMEGVDYRVEVMVPDETDTEKFKLVIKDHLRAAKIVFKPDIKVKMMFKANGFQKAPRPWIAISFHSLTERDKFLTSVPKNWATASDDNNRANTFYYQKIARENRFASAQWNKISNYTIEDISKCNNKCEYVFRLHLDNFRAITKTERAKFSTYGHPYANIMVREPLITASWDIETRGEVVGRPPTVMDKYSIPTICTSYQYYSETTPFLRVAVSMYDTIPREGIDVTITCGGSQRNTLIAHMEILGRMAPDIMYAFNGGHFDWPLYRKKLADEKLMVDLKKNLSCSAPSRKDTDESISKWNFRTENIKVNAENTHSMERAAFDGILDVDAMPTFLKLYPKMEVKKMESLNFFLKTNKLDLKEDMPIKRMMAIFDRAKELVNIRSCHCNKYCDCCTKKVPDLDCVPKNPGASLSDMSFTSQWHPEYFNEAGVLKCCYCAKVPKSRADIAEVNYYCVVDCIQPHKLFVKRTIIAEALALATMSYMSLFDALYRADGAKVYNFIASHFHKRGIAFSNARVELDEDNNKHFPGAFVVPPNKGHHSDQIIEVPIYDENWNVVGVRLQRARPITGLDFHSLYPSIMMDANFSTETMVKTAAQRDELLAEGYSLYHVKPYNYEVGKERGLAGNTFHVGEAWSVRHNGVFGANKTHIVEKYEKVITYTSVKNGDDKIVQVAGTPLTPEQEAALHAVERTRSVNYVPIMGRPAKVGEKMGTFAHIVKKLFDKRVPVKREVGRLDKILEEMGKAGQKSRQIRLKDGTERVCTVDEIEFMKAVEDAQQKAIKVLANTFYGKAGDRRGTLYDVDIAAGITTAGQRLIKFVAKYVVSRGLTVHYGDTDSLYLSCPDHLFEKCDDEYNVSMMKVRAEFKDVPVITRPEPGTIEAQYKAARIACRLKWWEQQVSISMDFMKKLQEDVFDILIADNGTLFLKMAYEEVGYPTYLCGNKKYFLTPHLNEVNFNAKPMVRGLESVKQGQTQLVKDFSDYFMKTTLSPEFEDDPLTVANEIVQKFCTMTPNVAEFALTARYKPDKQNIPVLKFIDRMNKMRQQYAGTDREILYEIPDPGDKFSYVVVHRDQQYTVTGNIVDMKKGDRMEYSRVYTASQSWETPLKIDMVYYMNTALAGILARFIAYHRKFVPAGNSPFPNKDDYKEFDAICTDAAKKYIVSYGTMVMGGGASRAEVGLKYKAAYRKVDSVMSNIIRSKIGREIDENMSDIGSYITRAKEIAATGASAASVDKFVKIMDERGVKLFKLCELYIGSRMSRGILTNRIRYCEDEIAATEARIHEAVGPIIEFTKAYDAKLEELVGIARADDNSVITVNDGDINIPDNIGSAIDLVDSLVGRLRGLSVVREQSLMMGRRMAELRANSIGTYREPVVRDMAALINSPLKVEKLAVDSLDEM